MTEDLDIDIEFGDENIIEENVFQFELTTDTSLIYNETQDIWYMQTEEDVEDDIFIIEDVNEDIYYTEEIEVFDYILPIADLIHYKEIVDVEKE